MERGIGKLKQVPIRFLRCGFGWKDRSHLEDKIHAWYNLEAFCVSGDSANGGCGHGHD